MHQVGQRTGHLRAQWMLRLKLLQLRDALFTRTCDPSNEGFEDIENLADLWLLQGPQSAQDCEEIARIALLDDHLEEQPELRMIQAILHIPHQARQRSESLRFLQPRRARALVRLQCVLSQRFTSRLCRWVRSAERVPARGTHEEPGGLSAPGD